MTNNISKLQLFVIDLNQFKSYRDGIINGARVRKRYLLERQNTNNVFVDEIPLDGVSGKEYHITASFFLLLWVD